MSNRGCATEGGGCAVDNRVVGIKYGREVRLRERGEVAGECEVLDERSRWSQPQPLLSYHLASIGEEIEVHPVFSHLIET